MQFKLQSGPDGLIKTEFSGLNFFAIFFSSANQKHKHTKTITNPTVFHFSYYFDIFQPQLVKLNSENKMKTLVTFAFSLFLVVCLFKTAHAQRHLIRNQGFFYGVEGFYGLHSNLKTDHVKDTDIYSPSSYGLKASANWFSGYHLSTGVALAILNYEAPNMITFPVLVNAQAYLNKGSNTPFAFVESGYGFRLNHRKQDKGFIYEAGVGYRYRLKRSNYLVIKAGYHAFINKEWDWFRKLGDEYDPNDPYRWYDMRRHTINLSIGFYHSTRY